jgi:hypothetical protein
MARWFLEGKKISWCGEEGRFLTEVEYQQILSAYETAFEQREEAEAALEKNEETITKLKDGNLILRRQLQGSVSNDYQPPRPGAGQDASGRSVRALSKAGIPAVRVEGHLDQSDLPEGSGYDE